MNNVSRSIFVGAALAMALAGCQKSDPPAAGSNGGPAQTAVSSAEIPKQPTGDASVPTAAAVEAKDAADKTAAMQDVNAMQHKAAPQEPMTKAEESKAMPLPGQANDHSTTALDKK